MKAQGFTLVELLAVIVILAVLALIATPVVLSIIDDTKESAMLRSAEMYLSGVENAVMRENMNSGGNFRPNECTISNGTLSCNGTTVEVEVNGEVPNSGSIKFENGKIKEVTLNYESGTIVKDNSGNLVYEGSSSNELDMSTVSSTLEENDWETIQKVVKADKVAEAGWSVGDTKTLEINGQTKEATIIGINHDGENTATFMIMSDIGSHAMNSSTSITGGWKGSEMRTWLNGTVLDSMSNKDQIKTVSKMTNTGAGYNSITSTLDNVFLLSPAEIGSFPSWAVDHTEFNAEGTKYEWFNSNSIMDNWFWLRSSDFNSGGSFSSYINGSIIYFESTEAASIYPVFVIG